MTNEEHIEEILIEAHSYGLRHEVLKTAKKFQQEYESKGIKVDKVKIFNEAFHDWVK